MLIHKAFAEIGLYLKLKSPIMKYFYLAALTMLSWWSNAQLVINELDSDTPSIDDMEFVELKSVTPNFSLDGYVLVFFNGSATSSTGNRSYYGIDLDGYSTDVNGLILIGNSGVSPVPTKYFPSNIIQNGADAVAIYQANASDFPDMTLATTTNLIDALIYGTSDPDAVGLMNLLGTSVQIDEDLHSQATSHSIQRKVDGSYEVKIPTPGANNDGSGISFNGLQITTSAAQTVEGGQFTITFTAQNPVSEDLSFTYSLNNGSFNSADYTANLNILIPQNSQSYSTTVTIIDDVIDDGDELAIIRFGNLPTGYNRVNDLIEVRIIDNDFVVSPWGTPLSPTYGNVSSTAPTGYYDSLTGKSGDELYQAIQDIIANPDVVREHNYGDVTTILEKADQNPLNSNEVWLMYVEQPRAKYRFQTTSSSVGSWNREHIFPQSRGGFSNGTESIPDGINVYLPTDADDLLAAHADAHHIRAEDGPENSARNNRDYGLDYNGPTGNQGSWKGDISRALFYMAVRYNELSLVNGNPPDTTPRELGDLASLLQWNHLDPSDDFEMNRNNIIYQWQINRNPFIDYPDLADYLWGNKVGQAWFPTLSQAEYEILKAAIYPNPSNGEIYVSGISTDAELTLYNITGVKVGQKKVSDMERVQLGLPSGIYLARISSSDHHQVLKLIIR